jgi:protein-tyrosine phosphatase
MNAHRSVVQWLIPEKLAKSSIPDIADLVVWQEEGIQSILNLLEDYYEDVVKDELRIGFKVLHSPIDDFGAPSFEQLQEIVKWIDDEIGLGRKVLVHCFGGIGRTGTVLLTYLMYQGDDLETAMEKVRKVGANPQSPEQLNIINEFYTWMQSTKNC